MARFEISDIGNAAIGGVATADAFFNLGMMYSIGSGVPVDLVEAHKWFNLSASRGNADAIRLRREVSEQMNQEEVAAALCAARAWLKAH